MDYVAIEELQIKVGARGCLLHRRERGDERGKLTQLDAADAEVLDRTQSLNPVQCVDGNVSLAEQVALAAGRARDGDARNNGRFERKLFQPRRKMRIHLSPE